MKWFDIRRINTSTVGLIKTEGNNGNRRFEKKDIIQINKQIRINGKMVRNGIMDINKNEIDVSDGKKKKRHGITALRLFMFRRITGLCAVGEEKKKEWRNKGRGNREKEE